MLHNFSVWREPQIGNSLPGRLWVKCRCGWTAFGLDHDELGVLAEDHRDEQQRLEELEREEAQHV